MLGGSGMKYSEFKKNVKLIGFEIKESNRDIYVERIHETVISVSKEFRFGVDTGWTGFSKEQENVLLALYAHACELAKTPLAEREEEKRYYLRLATKIDVYEDRRYLNMDIPNEKYTLSENKDDSYYKAIFTESEISQADANSGGVEKW